MTHADSLFAVFPFPPFPPSFSLPHKVPELTPSNNQTVPNNLGENVTYICTIPMNSNFELLWEVDNRQITPDIRKAFQDRGIFIMSGSSNRESTIIFTQEVCNYTFDTVELYVHVYICKNNQKVVITCCFLHTMCRSTCRMSLIPFHMKWYTLYL